MSMIELTVDQFPPKYEPDWEAIEGAESEGPHKEASFYLLREATQLMILVSHTEVQPITDRNLAINRGLIIRLTKLMRLMVRELASKETFQMMGITRSTLETVATLQYLIDDSGDGARYDQYVMNSLIAEREVVNDIVENIGKRDGETWPIEERMQRSIARVAKVAGIDDVSKLPGRKAIGFPSAEARVKALGFGAYTAYRMGSVEVHGDWTDLERNHLSYEAGRFTPRFGDITIRPQAPLTVALMSISVAVQNLSKVLGITNEQLTGVLEIPMKDLLQRLIRLNDLHEQYLQK